MAADREGALLPCDNGAIRKNADGTPVQALGATVQALAMQHRVYLAGTRRRAELRRLLPRLCERDSVATATFEAGPVTGGQRGHFVEEEQFGVGTTPDVAVAVS